jgi:hypothetical protein
MWEKLSTDSQIDQLACCGLGRDPFFSWAVDMFKSADDYVKGCYALTTWDTYGLWSYKDWARDTCDVLVEFPLQRVYRFKSSWLSDMSNRLFVVVST